MAFGILIVRVTDSPLQCRHINLVCIYLQVCTISDIATPVGGSLHLSAWKVEPFSDRRSNLSIPHQETDSNVQTKRAMAQSSSQEVATSPISFSEDEGDIGNQKMSLAVFRLA
jgi:hypothetical protein